MSQTTATSRTAHHRHAHRSSGRGLTLVELMCCLCITGLLLAGALPALRDFRLRQALESVAGVLETDVHYARSLARTSDRTVRMAVQATDDGGTCYVIHSGPAGACTCDASGAARCEGDAQLRRVQILPVKAGIRISTASRSLVFDAGKGTVTPTATFVVSDREGRAVHQIVNVLGRVRSCTPSGLGGYRRCA